MKIGRQVDIWSLGAVFSEAATWIRGGWPRLEEYREQRSLEAAKAVKQGCGEIFHDGKKLLKTVERNHRTVAKSCRADDLITRKVLEGPVADMLKEKPDDRGNVQQLYGRTIQILQDASDAAVAQVSLDEGEEEAPAVEMAPSSPNIPRRRDSRPIVSGFVANEAPSRASKAGGEPSTRVYRGPPAATNEPNIPRLLISQALPDLRNRRLFTKAHFAHEDQLSDLANMDHASAPFQGDFYN